MKNYGFNWDEFTDGYKGGSTLIPNKTVKGQTSTTICYSRAPYAQELFNLYTSDEKTIKKDLIKGDYVPVTDIYNIKNSKATIELSGGLSIDVDFNREKRFIQMYGYSDVNTFMEDLNVAEFREKLKSSKILAFIAESYPTVKISLWQGYIYGIKDEFMREIEQPTKAYMAKVIEANRGGYFVEVQGVEAFMPGSLAAPNKIIDFQTLIGKEVIVMIEDFLPEMNCFVVSHKKYIEHILPSKIAELNINNKYSGNITGSSKYGIFVEFNSIFTGLLHTSKMKEPTFKKFYERKFTPGDTIEFYISEITRDNRIILTEESPEEKRLKLITFIESNKDKVIKAEVSAILGFGIIVSMGELSGLLQAKELKKYKLNMSNFSIGNLVDVKIAEFKDDKILLEIVK